MNTSGKAGWLERIAARGGHQIGDVHEVCLRVNDALADGDFEAVNGWLDIGADKMTPPVAVALFRFALPGYRYHPARLPSWSGALGRLRARLSALGIDADHKLRGLPE